MLTPIGEMREPAAVLTPVRTTDQAGGEDITYTQGNRIYVALRATTTREGVQFGQIDADVTHVVFGHWHDLNALEANQKLRTLEDGTDYEVVGLPINSPKRDWTRLNVVRRG